VRAGVLHALAQDFELIGARTLHRLLAAGVLGVVGALGITLLVSGHPFGRHPPWHVLIFSTIWAGLLIVSLSLVFLRIRTPSLPIGRSAAVGVLGLGLAGLCSVVCPDRHFLNWWNGTELGAWVMTWGNLPASALCFGLLTASFFGVVSGFLILRERGHGAWAWALPAGFLFLLLEPGVILQSVGTSPGAPVGWTIGSGAGSQVGVACGIVFRASLARTKSQVPP
jgi:hypothetical protein